MSLLLARIMTRGLLLFNLVFLVQNLLDVEYLWAGAALPEGVTYAGYAHRGAYPLIATALIAGSEPAHHLPRTASADSYCATPCRK